MIKLSSLIFLISALLVVGCTNKLPEPEVKKDLPEINATISGEVWTPQYAGAVVSDTENLGGISIFIYDEAHLNSQKRNRLLQLSFTNNDFDWSPIRPINLFDTEDDFIAFSQFGENLDPFKRTYRTTDYNDAVGIEITAVRQENGIYYLDGKFKSQPCYGGGGVFPNCLNIVGTFKNMRVFESYTDMSWYFKIP